MALPATDSFTDSDGVQLTAHNASWTLCDGDFDIQSNALAADDQAASDECGAGWNADAFDPNQYAQATVVAIGSYVAIIGVAVRCDDDGPSATYYGFYGNDAESFLFKSVSGSWTQLDNGGAFAVSDLLRLEVSGVNPGSLSGLIGGVGAVSADDSDIDAGSAGVSGYTDQPASRIDDWEGGNLGGATIPIAAIGMNSYRRRRVA